MIKLNFIKYHTMNSWNNSTAPAFNLKVYNVIPREYQDKVYSLLDVEDFYDGINMLMHNFDISNDYEWQAGFNGRSSGYLVLYKGGRREDGRPFSYPGKSIDFEEVPKEVLDNFKQLAIDIVELAIDYAKNFEVVDEEYQVTKTRKVIKEMEEA